MMQLRPHQAITPLDRPVPLLRLVNGPAVKLGDVVVDRHRRENLSWRHRVFRVHVAPPEHRLDAPQCAHPTVQPEHVAQRRVDASLVPVVRGRQRAVGGQLGIEEGEQAATPN